MILTSGILSHRLQFESVALAFRAKWDRSKLPPGVGIAVGIDWESTSIPRLVGRSWARVTIPIATPIPTLKIHRAGEGPMLSQMSSRGVFQL